jgi:glucokinase
LSEDCQHQILAFDVGGSHIASSVFSAGGMSLGALSRIPAPANGSAEEFFKAFELLAAKLLPASLSPCGVSVAMPNPFDYDRGVSYMEHKYQQLYGIDLRSGLSERLGCDPARIHFLNDAVAFLMGELTQGAATGVSRAIGITLGTGVGSAFSVNGKIVVDGRGVPPGGETWNLPYGGGIVENVISTRAIQRMYAQLTGSRAEVHEIASLAGDHPQARETFECFGKDLGKVLRHICLEFAPERIVFGGGISRAAGLFLQAAERELADFSVQLRVSDLFERAPLIGAGVSWQQKDVAGRRQPEREPTGIVEEA